MAISEQMSVREMLLDRAGALLPRIREMEDQMESERRLPQELADAMVDAGLYKMWVPRSLGGFETDVLTFCDVIEEIAQASGAAAWNLMIGASFGYFAGFIDEDAAAEIYRDGNSLLAGNLNSPNGRAVAVDGGYRLSGNWNFGSGIYQASWIVANAFVFDGEQPRLKPDGEQQRLMVLTPRSTVTVHDTWYTLGLRGTGSNDFSMADIFVPEKQAFALDGSTPRYQRGILYYFPSAFHPVLAGPPLGITRGAIDAMRQMMLTRGSRLTGIAWKDDPVMQHDLGRAEHLLATGRNGWRDSLRAVWESLEAGREVSKAERLNVDSSTTQAVALAKVAVDLLFESCGGGAVYAKNPIERRYRDILTARQHHGFGRERVQQIGMDLLGQKGPTLQYRP